MIINKQESEALNITRFVMSIFIVFFHAYTSVQIYDYWKDLPVYRGVARFFSLQIGEMGVPVFFLISGYLFFGKYQQTWMYYKSKMQKRFYSLFVPYIFWNAFIIAAYYVAESIPTIQTLFNEGGKLVHDFDLHDFLFAFWSHKGGNPILTQMWFVRDLLLLVICAPIIYLLARYAKFVAIFCFGLIWFVKWEVPNWESGLLFFFIGACFSIYGKSIRGAKDSAISFYSHPIIIAGRLFIEWNYHWFLCASYTDFCRSIFYYCFSNSTDREKENT